ncbi:hypothetical protein ASE40_07685 [Flavobacterium sp. Root935]|jgi:hypothetical protein|nr:hypothetical protein ASE40_07685 [Flavobacterium sp. Root935]
MVNDFFVFLIIREDQIYIVSLFNQSKKIITKTHQNTYRMRFMKFEGSIKGKIRKANAAFRIFKFLFNSMFPSFMCP